MARTRAHPRSLKRHGQPRPRLRRSRAAVSCRPRALEATLQGACASASHSLTPTDEARKRSSANCTAHLRRSPRSRYNFLAICVLSFCYVICAIAGAANSSSKTYSFVVIWTMLLMLAYTIGGGLVVRYVSPKREQGPAVSVGAPSCHHELKIGILRRAADRFRHCPVPSSAAQVPQPAVRRLPHRRVRHDHQPAPHHGHHLRGQLCGLWAHRPWLRPQVLHAGRHRLRLPTAHRGGSCAALPCCALRPRDAVATRPAGPFALHCSLSCPPRYPPLCRSSSLFS